MAFWRKEKKDTNNEELKEAVVKQTDKEETQKEEQKLKCNYSLEAIWKATDLSESKYNYLKEKANELLEEMERNDPTDLPDNVSDDRYDEVSDKYDFLSNRYDRISGAIDIFEKIGYVKGGHHLNVFDEPLNMKFEYVKNENDIKERKVEICEYRFSNYKLSIEAKELGSEIRKTFLFEKIRNVNANGKNVDKLYSYLSEIVNRKLSEIIKNNEKC